MPSSRKQLSVFQQSQILDQEMDPLVPHQLNSPGIRGQAPYPFMSYHLFELPSLLGNNLYDQEVMKMLIVFQKSVREATPQFSYNLSFNWFCSYPWCPPCDIQSRWGKKKKNSGKMGGCSRTAFLETSCTCSICTLYMSTSTPAPPGSEVACIKQWKGFWKQAESTWSAFNI